MRKLVFALTVVLLATLGFAGVASAQDAVVGTIEADPATVPEAGEHTMTATGSEFIPDSDILVVSCVAPGDALVPGVSDLDAITEAALGIDALADCDLGAAVPITTDGDGGWTAELTAEVGDNFFLSAGALDGSQAGAVWIPIVDPAAAAAAADDAADDDALADTGVESGLLAVVGAAVLAGGTMIVREARKFD